jgi:excisionase family DNA binding protein
MASSRKTTKRKPRNATGSGRQASSAPSTKSRDEDLLTMDQAIARLKTTRPTFYRWLRAGKIKGMKVGRQWRFRPLDIDAFLSGEEPRIELPTSPAPLIKALEAKLGEAGGASKARLKELASEDPIKQTIGLMILVAAKMRASDLHLHPNGSTACMRVRVDGLMYEVCEFDGRLLPALIDGWMVMANCRREETRRAQDAVIIVTMEGKRIDMRISFMPTVDGMSMTGRILVASDVALSLDALDLSPLDRHRIDEAIHRPSGLIIMNGPTGCGKTTTVYACLSEINGPHLKVMTVEDPVEFRIKGLLQSQMFDDAMPFPAAIRAMLRSDPDVLFVGEARSSAILDLCNQAALTGHLVFTQMHANDSPSALLRMLDMGVDPLLVGDSVALIASQRLLRALCPKCSKPDKPSADQLARLGELAHSGGVSLEDLPNDWRRPVGCKRCAKTGYRGRTAAMETLAMSDQLAVALRRGATAYEIRSIAVERGMTTMGADAARRAAIGQTSIAEALRVMATTHP